MTRSQWWISPAPGHCWTRSFATNVTIGISGGGAMPLLGSLSGALAFGGALDPDLAAWFGSFPIIGAGDDSQNAFRLSFDGTAGTGTITQSTVQVNTSVPEPASMTLFGMMSLFGLAAFRRTAV